MIYKNPYYRDMVEKIDPNNFMEYLTAHGWYQIETACKDIKLFYRFYGNTVSVPVDKRKSDYTEIMCSAVEELAVLEMKPIEQILMSLLLHFGTAGMSDKEYKSTANINADEYNTAERRQELVELCKPVVEYLNKKGLNFSVTVDSRGVKLNMAVITA